MTSLGDDLQSIFGNEEIKAVVPRGWDRVDTPDFGLMALFGDTTNYNIELSNFPIQSNQTNDNGHNNSRTKRPINVQVKNSIHGTLNQY